MRSSAHVRGGMSPRLESCRIMARTWTELAEGSFVFRRGFQRHCRCRFVRNAGRDRPWPRNLLPHRRRVLTAAAVARGRRVACMTSIAPVNGQSPTAPGTWTMKAPLPAPRAEVAAVASTASCMRIGGSVNGTAGPYHDEYDPATDSWRPRAPLPEGRDHLGVAVGGRQDLCLRRLCRLGAQRRRHRRL